MCRRCCLGWSIAGVVQGSAINWLSLPWLGPFQRGNNTCMVLSLINILIAIIAAVAATLAARWGWVDRPSYLWHFRIQDKDGVRKQNVIVSFLGTAVAYNVKVRAIGYLHPSEKTGQHRSEMRRDLEPIEIATYRSKKEEDRNSETYIEVAWTTSRPRRRYGERINTCTTSLEVWRWSWRRLAIQRVPEALPRKRPYLYPWEYRVIRTSGRWVPVKRRPLHELPGF